MRKNVLITIIRWAVGLLFIFSGLVKANDPLGLSYKMQEFFEAWHLTAFHNYTLALSILMNAFEVLAGVALIAGWRIKLFNWLLLLLITFFTFLTAYVLWSGKIKSCGCFGDCIPLEPLQTFLKDVLLLILILILFFNADKIKPLFSNFISVAILIVALACTFHLQYYVLQHLPIVDCLPYRKGNDLLQQMQPPPNSVTDSFSITYKYQKNGKVVEFDVDHFPEDFDSTYQLVERYDKLVRKGNAIAPISDFSLFTLNNNDTTQQILNHEGKYMLVFINNFSSWNKEANTFKKVREEAQRANMPTYIVTSLPTQAQQVLGVQNILIGDATIIKTAARVSPTYFTMEGSKIIDKRAGRDVLK